MLEKGKTAIAGGLPPVKSSVFEPESTSEFSRIIFVFGESLAFGSEETSILKVSIGFVIFFKCVSLS